VRTENETNQRSASEKLFQVVCNDTIDPLRINHSFKQISYRPHIFISVSFSHPFSEIIIAVVILSESHDRMGFVSMPITQKPSRQVKEKMK
jgi:hypothetical protein